MSKRTILRHLGKFNGPTPLIEQRLQAEIVILKPIKQVCSLIIDDTIIREKMCYSRSEDIIYE